MPLPYQVPDLRLFRGVKASPAMVKELQKDLRRLGYLATGIDGAFGRSTEQAVQALQHDLLWGSGTGADGRAPVRIREYNKSRVTAEDGIVDEGLAAVMSDMLGDDRFAKVPSSAEPAAENKRILENLGSLQSLDVPAPFLIGIFRQESGLKHFREPSEKNDDNFVVLGLDRSSASSPAIGSRGYGIGQYTLFHHPPSHAEVADFVLDARGNISRAVAELLGKFLRFVNGSTPGTRADDRQAEFGRGPLRRCKYAPADGRYMRTCRQCLAAAGSTDIQAGMTRFYAGSSRVFEPTAHHPETVYRSVPVRANIGCDWPYAIRRYNGGGLDSYHYQAQLLLRVRDE